VFALVRVCSELHTTLYNCELVCGDTLLHWVNWIHSTVHYTWRELRVTNVPLLQCVASKSLYGLTLVDCGLLDTVDGIELSASVHSPAASKNLLS
jgi:hypothetical protein